MTAAKAVSNDQQKQKPTAEQTDTYTRRESELRQRFLKGSLDFDGVLDGLQKLMELPRIIAGEQITHKHLEHVSSFEVDVPKDFTLDGCSRDGFIYWHQNTTDANFKSTLKAGKKYVAEIYRLKRKLSSATLVEMGVENKRVMGGALGGALLCSRYGEKLPKDRCVVCIDNKKNFCRDSLGYLRVPNFSWFDDGWGFGLRCWSDGWREGFCVAFFREVLDPQV